jgi:hypothetical protein
MADALERAVKRIRQLPAERQIAAAHMLADFASAHRAGVYVLSDEERELIEEATAEVDRGEVAMEAEVNAVYAKFIR